MRKLLWFSLGFALACGFCAYLLPDSGIIPVVLCVVFGIATAVAFRHKSYGRAAVLIVLGCVAGFAWFSLFRSVYLQNTVEIDGEERLVTIQASDYGYETNYGMAVDGVLKLEGKPYQVRTYVNENQQIEPGDFLRGTFRFRVTTPDGKEEETYHSGKGIFLLAYQADTIEIQDTDIPMWCKPAQMRQQLKELLHACLPEDVYPFAKALLLGDGYDLDYETETAFQISGIRHIIAVSGLHISILFSLICLFTARKRFITPLVGIPVLLLFAAVTGFTPSVTRACIMVGLMMLAMLFDREYDSPTALAFACLVMLTVNPMVITSVGFQLSVGCVAGIQLFHIPIFNWLKQHLSLPGKLQSWFCTSLSVSISAMSLTTPLVAYYFGAVSLIGMVTNLLTLWVVNLVFNGMIVLCLLALLAPGIAAVLGWILAWPIRYVLFSAKVLASIPMAAVYTKSIYIVIWLCFLYVLLIILLLQKKKKPGLLGCCAAIGLCIALMISWAEPLLDGDRVTILDVGQGQSILLQSEGKTYLVDCGGDRDEETADIIAETLLSQGISRLDGIILTHFDRDHAGALPFLLTRIQTDLLILPDTEHETPIPEIRGKILIVKDKLDISYTDTKITVCGPIYDGYSNENSLCILFDTQNCDILITGDRGDFGERMLLRKETLPDVDLLIAGHHGAEDATSKELLEAVTPEVVVISAGKDNPYGHPAPELLKRLEDFCCQVRRTDLDGTIIYRG